MSMYRSIFPSALPAPATVDVPKNPVANTAPDALLPLPSPLATFPTHLIESLFAVLRAYMPNVGDAAARDSLMTQVLYCSGSLGRLGADFSMMLAQLEDDLSQDSTQDQQEWVRLMKKHRVQASRLELLASGVGTTKKDVAQAH